jgi:hypothetical protein
MEPAALASTSLNILSVYGPEEALLRFMEQAEGPPAAGGVPTVPFSFSRFWPVVDIPEPSGNMIRRVWWGSTHDPVVCTRSLIVDPATARRDKERLLISLAGAAPSLQVGIMPAGQPGGPILDIIADYAMDRCLLVYRMVIQDGRFASDLLSDLLRRYPSLRFVLRWCEPRSGCGGRHGRDGVVQGSWNVEASALSDRSALPRYERELVDQLLLEYGKCVS